MVVFLLRVKADLENVASLTPVEHNRWRIDAQPDSTVTDASAAQLKASDSDDEKKGVYISDEEELELGGGSKSLVHFVFTWPDTKKQCHVTLLDVKGVTGPYTAEHSGAFAPVIAFDCKGCEPTAWYPDADFDVRSVKGTLFEAVDLSQGEWTEYDEEQKDAELANLSVMGLTHEFKVHNSKK